MPELPEVETVRRQLNDLLIGRKIVDVNVSYAPIIQGDVRMFQSRLIHQTINRVNRYGKYLMFELDDWTLVSHLRMEGKYYLKSSDDVLSKHEHVVFLFEDGYELTYHDVRKFGTMELVQKGFEKNLVSINKLGPEVNDPMIDIKSIYQKIHRSSRPIKSLLLDQTIVCGLGNIYVDETLFLTRIHPETRGNRLTKKTVKALIDNARGVVNKAIGLGGTTIRSYHSTLGIDGLFQNELYVHTKKDEPCPICQTPIIKIRVGQRGTYFCPRCQKKGER